MSVWRNAISFLDDQLQLVAHKSNSFIQPTQHSPSPVLPFVSPRKRARPFNAQIWRKMEERASERGTFGRLHARSFLVIFMGKRGGGEGGRICIVTLPSLVARRGSDAASGSARPNVFLLLYSTCCSAFVSWISPKWQEI